MPGWGTHQWGKQPWAGPELGASNQITIAAGIPSAEAFGCGTAVNNDGDQSITICSGIPSAEAFGVQPSLSTVPNIAIAVGIPSTEAFGVPVTLAGNPAIVIANGIPSAEKVNSPALIPALARPTSAFLAGVDVTDLMLINTLQITDPLSGPSTATAKLYDPAGSLHPAVGQEFLVYRGTLRIFGGQVEESVESAYQATKGTISSLKLSDFSQILDRRVIGQYYTEGRGGNLEVTVSNIVTNFLSGDGITYNPIDGDPGVDLGIQLFNWITVRQAFNQIAQKTGWDFRIDPYRVLRFFPKTTGTASAPFSISQNDGNILTEQVTVRTYRGKYRNREFIIANTQGNPLWCETFSTAHPGLYPSSPQPPDGNRIFFTTFYSITKTPQVTVNGIAQRVVSIQDIATKPYDWYWFPPDGFGVAQNQANPRLTSSDTLIVCYQTQLPPAVVVQDNAQILARQAIEGGSGIYDDVAQAQDILDPAGIAAYGQGLLTRFGSSGIPREVVYTTTPNKHGLAVGQLQQISLASPLIPSGLYLVATLVTKEVDKQFLQYVCTATTGANPGDWTAFFAALQRRSQLTIPSLTEKYVFQIAPSYAGITNPGAVGGLQGQPHIIRNAEELLQFVTVYFTSPPTGGDLPVNVVLNGSFALGITSPTYPQSSTSPQTYYFQQPQRAFAGDVLQVFIGDVGGPGKNGKDGLFTVVSSVAA